MTNHKRTYKPTILDQIMNEVTLYGGIPLRRYDVISLAKAHLGEHAKEPFGAQYFAMHGPAVDMQPWTREDAERLMGRD